MTSPDRKRRTVRVPYPVLCLTASLLALSAALHAAVPPMLKVAVFADQSNTDDQGLADLAGKDHSSGKVTAHASGLHGYIGFSASRPPERRPTWSSVFQTVEGGLGYWAGHHFRYGSPKFSMNATPQCYDY
jgi:hypothetical protein